MMVSPIPFHPRAQRSKVSKRRRWRRENISTRGVEKIDFFPLALNCGLFHLHVTPSITGHWKASPSFNQVKCLRSLEDIIRFSFRCRFASTFSHPRRINGIDEKLWNCVFPGRSVCLNVAVAALLDDICGSLMADRYKLTESHWAYCGGGWQMDTPIDTLLLVMHMSAIFYLHKPSWSPLSVAQSWRRTAHLVWSVRG